MNMWKEIHLKGKCKHIRIVKPVIHFDDLLISNSKRSKQFSLN